MKRLYIFAAIAILCQTALCQKKYEMVVEKTDGTETVINVEDIVRTYFREIENGNNPGDNTPVTNDALVGTWIKTTNGGVIGIKFTADGKAYYNEWNMDDQPNFDNVKSPAQVTITATTIKITHPQVSDYFEEYSYILSDDGKSVTLTLVSWNKDNHGLNGTFIKEDPQATHDDRFDEVVPPEWQSRLTDHMSVYSGMNPPNIEGVYLINPVQGLYRSYGEGGWTGIPQVLHLYNQNMQERTIELESYTTVDNNIISYSEGKGAFVNGEGNNFTIFLNTEGHSQGLSRFKQAKIITGTKTSEGIVNLHVAIIMKEIEVEPNTTYAGMGVGDWHIYCDSDGLSENTIWNMPSTRNVEETATTEFLKILGTGH